MTTVAPVRLAEVLVELADTLVEEFDLVDFLQMLTTRTTEVAGTTAAGLLLADERDRLHFMAASDEKAHLLELFQVQADEGPCRDSYHQGAPVTNSDLRRAGDRWPRFAPRAVALGFRSVHAFPLRLRGEVIGALGLFDASEGRLQGSDVPIIQSLADMATIGLLQERAIRRREVLTEQLQGALNSRIAIEQAKGAVAQLLDVSVDDAFQRLRAFARAHNRRLTEVAQEIVTDPRAAAAFRDAAGGR